MAQSISQHLVTQGCPAQTAADVDAVFAKLESQPGAFNIAALLKLFMDVLTQNWTAIPQDIINLFLPTPVPPSPPTPAKTA